MNPTADATSLTVLVSLSSVIVVALYVWLALALSAMFRKMGEAAWKGWVPFLNLAVLLRWGGFNPWLVLLLIIPGLGMLIVYALVVVAAHRLGPGFGYGSPMTVVAALLFPVWVGILGFGPARWLGARPPSAANAASPDTDDGADFAAPPLPPPPPLPPMPPLPTVDAAVAADVEAESFAPPPVSPESASPFADAPGEVTLNPFAPTIPPPGAAASPAVAPPPVRAAAPSDERRPGAEGPPTEPLSMIDGVFDDGAWPDEVSADAPAPFPPNTATPADVEEAPISSVPGYQASAPVDQVPPALTRARLREQKAREAAAMATSEDFPEVSGETSAVIGSPVAGAPQPADTAVIAQQREQDSALEDDMERTVISSRHRPRWQLVLPDGASIALTADAAVLGRRPTSVEEHPDAQLISLIDPTRTVSKRHALIELRDEVWHVTDLHSTNGVLVVLEPGTEVELEPGEAVAVGESFLLGDAEFRVLRTEG
ncbi:DUF5684 domain-containing protein [Microbacterium sp.]|uniref:DUF5684 domain-containing protein n=1 Tax=Microbacterium sp. TaxID=51671 RepID=UPI003A882900